MPLWSLEPDPDGVLAAKWASSCHKGTAIVRAPDEKTARICASLTFSGFPGWAQRFRRDHFPPQQRYS